MTEEKNPAPIANPPPAAPSPNSDMANIIKSMQADLQAAREESAAAIAAANQRAEELNSKLETYTKRDAETAKSLYDGLSDEGRKLADAVKDTMPADRYLDYLGLLPTKTPDAGPPPGIPRGDTDDSMDEGGTYNPRFANEFKRRMGRKMQHIQEAEMQDLGGVKRLSVPLGLLKKQIRLQNNRRLDDDDSWGT